MVWDSVLWVFLFQFRYIPRYNWAPVVLASCSWGRRELVSQDFTFLHQPLSYKTLLYFLILKLLESSDTQAHPLNDGEDLLLHFYWKDSIIVHPLIIQMEVHCVAQKTHSEPHSPHGASKRPLRPLYTNLLSLIDLGREGIAMGAVLSGPRTSMTVFRKREEG